MESEDFHVGHGSIATYLRGGEILNFQIKHLEGFILKGCPDQYGGQWSFMGLVHDLKQHKIKLGSLVV